MGGPLIAGPKVLPGPTGAKPAVAGPNLLSSGAPKAEPATKERLDALIASFPYPDLTRACVDRMKYSSGAGLGESEKIAVLELCSLYAMDYRQLILVRYVGMLETRNAATADIPGLLARARKNPNPLPNVNEFSGIGLDWVKTEIAKRQAAARARNRSVFRKDEED